MSFASTSTSVLRCCRTAPRCSSSSVVHSASLSTKSRKPATEGPPRPHKTPAGTNAKPAASGRPKRYITRYGIPPLNPSLLGTGEKRLNREATEKAQSPDFQKIWRLEDEISAGVTPQAKEKARSDLARLRADQPRRHPLWAFFREKTSKEAEDEERYRPIVKQKLDKDGNEIEQPALPGTYSLAVSLQRPDASSGMSGRSWHADELRRKSFQDLHNLWYIILIEKNALHTQKDEAKRSGVDWSGYSYIQEQLHRCRKSMARIKFVLHERRKAAVEAQGILKNSQDPTQAETEAEAAGVTGTAEAGSRPASAPGTGVHTAADAAAFMEQASPASNPPQQATV